MSFYVGVVETMYAYCDTQGNRLPGNSELNFHPIAGNIYAVRRVLSEAQVKHPEYYRVAQASSMIIAWVRLSPSTLLRFGKLRAGRVVSLSNRSLAMPQVLSRGSGFPA